MSKAKHTSHTVVEKDTSERWLLTYADLITLLCIFFIILYVFSASDVQKFRALADSLHGIFTGTKVFLGDAPGPSFIAGESGMKPRVNSQITELEKMEMIKRQIEEMAKKEGLQSSVSVTLEERGVVIRIVDQILFQSGEADLSGQARGVLHSIGKILLVNKDQYMRIEGHTDNVPIATGTFQSNWELSAKRATNVVGMFINDASIDPKLMCAVGYGEFRPVDDNKTEAGRTKNRRVEIVILASKYNKSESQGVTAEAPQEEHLKPENHPIEKQNESSEVDDIDL